MPNCDFSNPRANGECGALPNANYGLARAPSIFFDPAYLTGWGSRAYLWSSSLNVQHELRPGVGLTVGYYRTAYGNFTVTDNRALGPADYDPFTITAPADPRLPDSGGYPVTYLAVNKFVASDNYVTFASKYGKQIERKIERWWKALPDKSCRQTVKTYYGVRPLHELLERCTWHSAQHARQMITVLEGLEAAYPP